MICRNCDTKMKCEDSREANNKRYRKYKCTRCNEILYTTESTDLMAKICIGNIVADLDTKRRKLC